MDIHKTQSELALLKLHYSPHFLYNTLNNIETLVWIDQEKASNYIMKLSSLLRYMTKVEKGNKILFSEEIEYLKSYLELERLRVRNGNNIVFEFPLKYQEFLVPPMLFIPFIENALKHGLTKESNTIKAYLKCTGKKVEFMIFNSISVRKLEKDNVSGIGLELIRNRLNSLFGSKFKLTIEHSSHTYKVLLKLDCS